MEQDMLSVDPGNFSWKNKLEDVNALAGELLADKAATWERLHSRLRPRPRRSGIVWYWAAACLLAMVSGLLLINKNRREQVWVKNNIVKVPAGKMIAPQLPVLKQTAATTAAILAEKKKQINVHKKTSRNEILSPDTLLKTEMVIAATPTDSSQLPPSRNVSSLSANEPVAIASVQAPAKTKLKVVHVNELGEPIEGTYYTGRITDHQSLQAKLVNQKLFSSPAVSLNNTGFNIFSTKNAPAN